MKKRILSVVLSVSVFIIMISSAFVTVSAASINERYIYNFLKNEMGLNTAAACGVIANLKSESNFTPRAQGDYKDGVPTSFGLCQWHNSRADRMFNFCDSNGYSRVSMEGQLRYLKFELEKYYPSVLAGISEVENTSDGAYQAAYHWCYYFEKPANTAASSDKRGNIAVNTYWPVYSPENDYPVTLETSETTFEFNVQGTKSGEVTVTVASGEVPEGANMKASVSDGIVSVKKLNVPVGYVYKVEAVEPGIDEITFKLSASDGTVLGVKKINAIVISPTYDIIYRSTDDTANMPGKGTKTHGEVYTISSTVPTRDGYSFRGWSTSSAAATVNYEPGDLYRSEENLTLYAVWKELKSTVTYHGPEAATGIPESVIKDYAVNINISSAVPVLEGHDFLGWAVSEGSADVAYLPGAVYSEDKDLNLYAVFKVWTYDVNYYSTEDTLSLPEKEAKNYGEEYAVSNVIPVREGYKFLGWSTDKESCEVAYSGGDKYSGNAVLNLYAVWEKLSYSVNYHSSVTAENIPQSATKYYGEDINISSHVPSAEGSDFLGWATEEGSTEVRYAPGDLYEENADLDLYAVFRLRTYSVTYVSDGSPINLPVEETKTYGKTYTVSGMVPTEFGRTFLGWAEKEGSEEVAYLSGSEYTENADLTLYAVWEIWKTSDYGDVTGDESIDATDLTRIKKYLSGINVAVTTGADLNGDGSVDALDLTRLKKYLAGQPVILGPEN